MSAYNRNYGGIVVFLVCLIVLVLAGAALSLFADGWFARSKFLSEHERQLVQSEDELRHLRLRHAHLAREFNQREAAWIKYTEVSRCAREKTDETDRMNSELDALFTQVGTAESGFADYQKRHRDRVRAAASGTTYMEFRTGTNKIYRDVVIQRVTAAGLEIRHADGLARIAPSDLPSDMTKRFHWNEERRNEAFRMERQRMMAHLASPVVAVHDSKTAVPDKKRPKRESAEAAKARELKTRMRYVTLRTRVSRLTSEYHRATDNAASSRSRSVPGSLESWPDRSARLMGELVKARAELQFARQELVRINPKDILLKSPVPGP